jgi:hypothetical protein
MRQRGWLVRQVYGKKSRRLRPLITDELLAEVWKVIPKLFSDPEDVKKVYDLLDSEMGQTLLPLALYQAVALSLHEAKPKGT